MVQPLLPSTQPSAQKPPRALPSVDLTTHPIRFYTSLPVQPFHSSSHPHHTCRPSSPNSNLQNCESSAPSGYGQLYVCGLEINQTYMRAIFEVGASSAQTDLPIYSKKPGRTDVRETASTSQPTGPTANQTSSPTLSVIAQSGLEFEEDDRHSMELYILDDDTSGWEFQNHNLSEFLAFKGIIHQNSCTYTPQQNGVAKQKNRHLVKVTRSLMLSTSLPSYLWEDVILIAAHLINRMPSRILHLQTPLECLKESFPFTCLVSKVPLRVFECTAYVHILALIRPNLPLELRLMCLLGKSVSEESNNTFEFIEHTPSTLSDIDPHPIILPTNQVPWKPYYRRNLIKEVEFPTSQLLALVQDSEPPRDQSMENPIELYTNNKMSENDKSDVVLENEEEKNRGDETGVRIETNNNEAEQGNIAILIVYVDDTGLSRDDHTKISQLKQRMSNEFEIKDLGNLKYFIEIKVARSKEGISMSKRKYTLDLLTKIGMLGCRPVDAPIEFNCKLGNSDDQVPVDKEQYQCLVDKLIYLSHTRPDISFAKVLSDLHPECETPLKLFCDNNVAINIANNPVQHDRTKHVEIDRHFIKERLDSGNICIPYIPSS
ncbi:putative mitochondrial protein [Cucumis melo var. makuwa]|uniref:Mitochondrial protein n=1 Tax=Cucumis melo var. makuwa TaxID=1194695 RepID=A0A5A7UVB2_CUCMM|nr:putative mitochondrial protein [Cucumis melo var. makuwa]TYK30180.1 putative mitochondrial protein [Cucumis melo var. makuwa]